MRRKETGLEHILRLFTTAMPPEQTGADGVTNPIRKWILEVRPLSERGIQSNSGSAAKPEQEAALQLFLWGKMQATLQVFEPHGPGLWVLHTFQDWG